MYFKPQTTPDSNGQEWQSSSTKSGWTWGTTANVIRVRGLDPEIAITGTAMKRNEKTVDSEKIRYYNSITGRRSDGEIQWDFDINDVRYQKVGFDMPKDSDVLPTVQFKFVGEPPPPLPNDMDVVITSFWSMIPSPESLSDLKSIWIIRKALKIFRPTDDIQTPSYSNLLQKVALNASNLSKPSESYYQANVEFRPGTEVPHEVIVKNPAAGSVNVTPSVVCT